MATGEEHITEIWGIKQWKMYLLQMIKSKALGNGGEGRFMTIIWACPVLVMTYSTDGVFQGIKSTGRFDGTNQKGMLLFRLQQLHHNVEGEARSEKEFANVSN